MIGGTTYGGGTYGGTVSKLIQNLALHKSCVVGVVDDCGETGHRTEDIRSHHAGDSRKIELQITEESQSTQNNFGDPIDISNVNEIIYKFSRKKYGVVLSKFTKTKSGGGITVTDGPNGKCEILWNPSDTSG
jgi:hypothetical protein